MPVKNILVVDDSPTERFFSVDLLTKAGYQVTTAKMARRELPRPRRASPT
jgi:twitching motility two-component system response regulator PilH